MDVAIAEKGLIVFDLIVKENPLMLHIIMMKTLYIKLQKS